MEMKIYAVFDSFHWSEDHQGKMQHIMLQALSYLAEHPQEYRELLALGERLTAIATLPEDAPEVIQLAHDFTFGTFSFLIEHAEQLFYPTNKAFSQVAAEIMPPTNASLRPSRKRISSCYTCANRSPSKSGTKPGSQQRYSSTWTRAQTC
jgi:hypothetical protein